MVGARGAEEVATGTVLPSASATSVCFARFAAGPSPASTAPGAAPAAVVAAVGSPDETTDAVMLPSCLPLVDGVSNLIPGSAGSGVPCNSSKMFTGHDSKIGRDDTIKLLQMYGVSSPHLLLSKLPCQLL